MAKMEIPSSDEFAGTDRFQLLRCIGEGGMGVVYEALDHETKSRVALKTMRQLNGTALLHFKNEFRALQDIDHPNLVSLGELVQAGGRWFFTMELVEGDDFIRYVRTDGGRTKLLDTQAGRSTQVELRRAASGFSSCPRRFMRSTGRPRRRRPASTRDGCARRSASSPGASSRFTRRARSTATSSRRTSSSAPLAAWSSSTSGW
jgi:hypothetical protein